MHLIGFIIRIYHDARSPERQMFCCSYCPGLCLRELRVMGDKTHGSETHFSYHQASCSVIIQTDLLHSSNIQEQQGTVY